MTSNALVTTGRRFELELRCPGSARTCEGRVTVRELGKRILARGEVSLAGGVATKALLEVDKRGFKRVRRHGPLTARVVMKGRDATGGRIRLRSTVSIGVPAREKSSLLLGVADDRIQGETARHAGAIRGLGLGAVRILLAWRPGQSELEPEQVEMLTRIVTTAPDLRIMLSSRSETGRDAPATATERDAYCAFVGDVAGRFPQISDFGIWIEPNKQQFWAPQFDSSGASVAPARYEALLARCWDVLHAIRPDVNVIGPNTASQGNDRPHARSNVSHAPGTFIRLMGEAYRASGRSTPIFDTAGHHPYGESSAERPWKEHTRSNTIGLGDWSRLMQAFHDAFAGTGQMPPGLGGTEVWYTESGFQTRLRPSKAHLYSGRENDDALVPEAPGAGTRRGARRVPDQGMQLRDAIRLAYCQPYVTGFFDFLLYDETSLERWQSGVFWADETPKHSAAAYAEAVASATAGRINCTNLKHGPVERAFVPKSSVGVTRVGWVRATSFNHKHDLWRAQVQLDEPTRYEAAIVQVRRRGTSAIAVGEPARTIAGTLRRGFFQWVTFPRERLAPGLYRIEIDVTSQVDPSRKATLDGPVFRVRARKAR